MRGFLLLVICHPPPGNPSGRPEPTSAAARQRLPLTLRTKTGPSAKAGPAPRGSPFRRAVSSRPPPRPPPLVYFPYAATKGTPPDDQFCDLHDTAGRRPRPGLDYRRVRPPRGRLRRLIGRSRNTTTTRANSATWRTTRRSWTNWTRFGGAASAPSFRAAGWCAWSATCASPAAKQGPAHGRPPPRRHRGPLPTDRLRLSDAHPLAQDRQRPATRSRMAAPSSASPTSRTPSSRTTSSTS